MKRESGGTVVHPDLPGTGRLDCRMVGADERLEDRDRKTREGFEEIAQRLDVGPADIVGRRGPIPVAWSGQADAVPGLGCPAGGCGGERTSGFEQQANDLFHGLLSAEHGCAPDSVYLTGNGADKSRTESCGQNLAAITNA